MKTKNNNDNHSVSYTSIDYHSMCQKSKDKIRRMKEMGMTTPHDPNTTRGRIKKDGGCTIFFMS